MSFRNKIMRGAGLARLGADFVRVRRADESSRSAVTEEIVARMASLRGLPQKVGQILSVRAMGNGSVDNPYESLTEEGQAVPLAEFRGWLEKRLGAERFREFKTIDQQGFAASIGQVHRAILSTGETVAVKAQYPGIAEAFETDLSALGLMLAPLGFKAKRLGALDFGLIEYRSTLGAGIRQELDYTAELYSLTRALERAREIPGIIVPKPLPHLSCRTVLTMSWIEGMKLHEFLEASGSHRTRAAQILLRWFLRSLFLWGEIHADPHAGNYRFQISGTNVSVGLLDFGCTYRLTDRQVLAFRALLADRCQEVSSSQALDLLSQLGFKADLLQPMVEKLPRIIKHLAKPFRTRGPFDIQNWKLRENLEAILGDDRWNFRLAGPASLTFFIRSFFGLLQQLQALGAVLDWGKECTALGIKTDYSPSVEPAQCYREERREFDTELKILVEENGEQRAKITLPAASVENLESLMPDDVVIRLRERGVDAEKIGQDVYRRGCPPEQLFGLDDAHKRIRVWLEKCVP